MAKKRASMVLLCLSFLKKVGEVNQGFLPQ
jgi:hypothetical protein